MAFERIRKHKLKINPFKCAFRVHTGNILSFLSHQRGTEVDGNKAKMIIETQPSKTKKKARSYNDYSARSIPFDNSFPIQRNKSTPLGYF